MMREQEFMDKLSETRRFIIEKVNIEPQMGVILGSGLGGFVDLIEDKVVIPYQEIPNFPVSTVEGHKGQLVFGKVLGKTVVAMQGRFHFYEGYSMQSVTFPVRVMQVLGVSGLIVTNAAGGINPAYRPGDLILIKDHINMMGDNPLRGANLSNLGPRFPDLSEGYDLEWRQKALTIAREVGIHPQEGVYAAMSGPSYESPAEIRFLRTIGADLVGMSTVPEVIIANHGGMRVLGISCVTNMAAGILAQRLSHAEVMETAERIEKQFVRFVQALVKGLA
ncbi:purine nucleoside phosphorylase I, inosine and guanosine-specific [Desulfitobacterium hafniense DCB-2]|uniref:Purine nucleoside phosphorylase n=2 Tax=Desulfitobacterium hafniense TaxID=49338 RepID=G9XLB6_DESHA|nr:purine-nucleoside phosphorylase [Desulfitobacterium hafniense]ACL21466.1 purine nucleoside phosphorylase I, inosine and guanosine-specific [Desulfitobacterium hafniense DCB-2]EHL07633.1 purine nucleoside phosphorylase I, inosine and guanosine-specific [Desulfitobacterium hafniense DP7]